MLGILLFFLFHTLSEMQFYQAFDYSNNYFREYWKVCINGTTNFLGHKNKAGDCHESMTLDQCPFIYDLYRKYNATKSFYAKSSMTGKKR